MMLSVVDLAPHSVVEEHSHPHEQVGILLEGRIRFTIGGEEKVLTKGDMWRIPGNVKHKVIVLDEPAKALDIFAPPREDYV
jgi:quercetin dioxygenase-like cupin family protein